MVKKTRKQSAKATADDILQAIDQIVQAQNPAPHKTEQPTEDKKRIDSIASQITTEKGRTSHPSPSTNKGLPAIPTTMASTSYTTKAKEKTSYQIPNSAHHNETTAPKSSQSQPPKPPLPPRPPQSKQPPQPQETSLPMLELTDVIDENGSINVIPLLKNTLHAEEQKHDLKEKTDALLKKIIPEMTKKIQKQIGPKGVNQKTLQNIIAQSAQESLASWRRKNTVKKS